MPRYERGSLHRNNSLLSGISEGGQTARNDSIRTSLVECAELFHINLKRPG